MSDSSDLELSSCWVVDPGYILKVQPQGFPDGLNVKHETNTESVMTRNFSPEQLETEMGKITYG